MLKMHLVLKTRSESILELALPLSFRITFAVIASILIASMVSLSMVSVIPLIVAVITVLAGLYEERWFFDRSGKQVVHRYGLIVFARNRAIPFDEINSFVLSNLREIPEDQGFSAKKSMALRSLVSMQIELASGEHRTIEIRANRHNASLKESAERVSEFCGIPLEFTA